MSSIDGEFAARLALGDALREHARRHAVGKRHAVADEQDDVLRLARPAVVDVPLEFTRVDSVADAQPINAGLRERNVAQDQGGLVLGVFALDKSGGLAENLGMVFAVHRRGDLGRIGKACKFDFEVEPSADQNIGSIDRIDRLRGTDRTNHRNRNTSRGGKEPAHAILQLCGHSHPYCSFMTAG